MSATEGGYVYDPVSASENVIAPDGPVGVIRLLHFDGTSDGSIMVKLQAYKLAEDPIYEALSYEWGQHYERETILVDGKPLDIPHSLFLFLKSLRSAQKDEKTLYFADAICIDQQNLQERAQQVQLMGQVYTMAQRVHIWLGSDFGGVSRLFKFGNLLRGNETDARVRDRFEEVFSEHNEAAFQEAVQALTSCSYWKRLWVIQEILLAKRLLVHCGKYTIAWNALYECCQRVLLGEVWKTQSDPSSSFGGAADAIAEAIPDDFDHSRYVSLYLQTTTGGSGDLSTRPRPHKITTRSRRLYTLKEAIMLHSFALCTDRHDCIYGLLGLVLRGNDRGYFLADYGESLASLFQRVMHHCHPELRNGSIEFCRHLWQALGLSFVSDEDSLKPNLDATENTPFVFPWSLRYSIVVRFAGRLKGQAEVVASAARDGDRGREQELAPIQTWKVNDSGAGRFIFSDLPRPGLDIHWSTLAIAQEGDLVYSIDDSCCGVIFRKVPVQNALPAKRKRSPTLPPIFVGRTIAHTSCENDGLVHNDIQGFLRKDYQFASKLVGERPLLEVRGAPWESQVSLPELWALTCDVESVKIVSSSSTLDNSKTVRPFQPEPPAQKRDRVPTKKRRFDFQWTSEAGNSQ